MLESRHFPVIVFAIALLARVFYSLLFPALPYNIDAAEYVILGQSISEGNGLCYEAGHPTAYRLPLYPMFLSVFFFLFGDDCWTAIAIGESFVGAFAVLALLFASSRLVGRRRPGAIAALILAIYPPHIVLTRTYMTENLFSLLVVLCVLLLLKTFSDPSSRFDAVLAGIVLGFSWLCRPTLFLLVGIIPLWAVLAMGPEWGTRRLRLMRTAILIAAALATLSPWVARNAMVMKAFIPLDTHGGATIWYQHNSLSEEGYFWSAIPQEGLIEIRRRINEQRRRLDAGESLRDVMLPIVLKGPMAGFEFLGGDLMANFGGLSEKARDEAFWDDAMSTIRRHPIRYFKKSAKEAVKFWHIFDDYGRFVGSYVFLLPFAAIGLLLFLYRRRYCGTMLYLSPLLCAWILGATVNASHRFRLPFEPLMITFMGIFLDQTARSSTRTRVFFVAASAVYGGIVLFVFLYPETLRETIRAISTWLGFSNYPVY
ncbi:glycosyltransferase family 39 protein [bacterium]|nr:glycosyltransferase family 39 protein [bacterium]